MPQPDHERNALPPAILSHTLKPRRSPFDGSDPVAASRSTSFLASGNLVVLPGLAAAVFCGIEHIFHANRFFTQLLSFSRAQNDIAILGWGPFVSAALALAAVAVLCATSLFVLRSRRKAAADSAKPLPRQFQFTSSSQVPITHTAIAMMLRPANYFAKKAAGNRQFAADKRPVLEHVTIPCEPPVAYSRIRRPIRNRFRSRSGMHVVLPPAVAMALQAQLAAGPWTR